MCGCGCDETSECGSEPGYLTLTPIGCEEGTAATWLLTVDPSDDTLFEDSSGDVTATFTDDHLEVSYDDGTHVVTWEGALVENDWGFEIVRSSARLIDNVADTYCVTATCKQCFNDYGDAVSGQAVMLRLTYSGDLAKDITDGETVTWNYSGASRGYTPSFGPEGFSMSGTFSLDTTASVQEFSANRRQIHLGRINGSDITPLSNAEGGADVHVCYSFDTVNLIIVRAFYCVFDDGSAQRLVASYDSGSDTTTVDIDGFRVQETVSVSGGSAQTWAPPVGTSGAGTGFQNPAGGGGLPGEPAGADNAYTCVEDPPGADPGPYSIEQREASFDSPGFSFVQFGEGSGGGAQDSSVSQLGMNWTQRATRDDVRWFITDSAERNNAFSAILSWAFDFVTLPSDPTAIPVDSSTATTRVGYTEVSSPDVRSYGYIDDDAAGGVSGTFTRRVRLFSATL